MQAVQKVTSLVQATLSQAVADYAGGYTTGPQLQSQTTRSNLAVRAYPRHLLQQ